MKSIKFYMLTGTIFVSVLGTLFHFVYEWSGNNVLVGLFTPINESIWEHTKLLFFPMLIYSVYLTRKTGAQYPCIGAALISGTLAGAASIIALFYTYSGIIGFNVAAADISIFFISVIISFYIVYKIATTCKDTIYNTLSLTLWIMMICLYIIFTISPPQIPLFISP